MNNNANAAANQPKTLKTKLYTRDRDSLKNKKYTYFGSPTWPAAQVAKRSLYVGEDVAFGTSHNSLFAAIQYARLRGDGTRQADALSKRFFKDIDADALGRHLKMFATKNPVLIRDALADLQRVLRRDDGALTERDALVIGAVMYQTSVAVYARPTSVRANRGTFRVEGVACMKIDETPALRVYTEGLPDGTRRYVVLKTVDAKNDVTEWIDDNKPNVDACGLATGTRVWVDTRAALDTGGSAWRETLVETLKWLGRQGTAYVAGNATPGNRNVSQFSEVPAVISGVSHGAYLVQFPDETETLVECRYVHVPGAGGKPTSGVWQKLWKDMKVAWPTRLVEPVRLQPLPKPKHWLGRLLAPKTRFENVRGPRLSAAELAELRLALTSRNGGERYARATNAQLQDLAWKAVR